ncbi:MAG TPA: DUF4175 family protein [Rhizomicrobium sp.]|nr:DUF4175 family protein [Rhizomicrobium sp.]
MTSSLPKTASQTGWRTDRQSAPRVKRATLLARIVLAVERVVPALWPAIGIVGLYFTAALFGLFLIIPWIAQSILLASAITATGLALAGGFREVRWPSRLDAARRLERDSVLSHRPISEADDRLMAGSGDPIAMGLWARHQARAFPDHLHVAWPNPDFESRDPHRLHLALLALLAASLIVARGDWRARLVGAFDGGAAASVSLDAWVDPPPYTGLAPVYLPASERQAIAVPFGSILNLRVHGAAHAPGISVGDMHPPHFTGEAGEYAATARLTHDGRVRVQASGHRIGYWMLRVIPDRVPVISFTAPPSVTERDAVKFAFRATDDYGVTSARVMIHPHGKPGASLIVDLPLAPAKTVTETSYSDLTGHPYAGLMVDAHLEARDGAGQMGVSKTVTFRLPERVFTDPLARALIEQRQALATSVDRAGRRAVAEALSALTIAPDKFYVGQEGVYAGIRAAYWGVRSARARADIDYVETLLWQIAMAIEQKGMLTAANSLRQLQALITAALAAHAPQPVIDQLLQRYDQAMQRYLEALLQNSPNGKAQQQAADPNAKNIGLGDLDKMMKAIQQLSQSGNREAAAQMLAALQNMLENMRVSKSASGNGQGGEQQNSELNQAIQQYGEMMGQQRALMDKTLRQQQGNGDPKDGGAQGLAKQQDQLRQKLNQAMQKLGKRGEALGKAGKAMDEAQKSLNSKDLANASNAENNALQELRKGADELAKEMQNNGNSNQAGGREDPLGRGDNGPGNMIKLPDPNDLARARDILQELRRRAGQRNRPQEELDYLDRLLKEF